MTKVAIRRKIIKLYPQARTKSLILQGVFSSVDSPSGHQEARIGFKDENKIGSAAVWRHGGEVLSDFQLTSYSSLSPAMSWSKWQWG